jgi:hypothetical protein
MTHPRSAFRRSASRAAGYRWGHARQLRSHIVPDPLIPPKEIPPPLPPDDEPPPEVDDPPPLPVPVPVRDPPAHPPPPMNGARPQER